MWFEEDGRGKEKKTHHARLRIKAFFFRGREWGRARPARPSKQKSAFSFLSTRFGIFFFFIRTHSHTFFSFSLFASPQTHNFSPDEKWNCTRHKRLLSDDQGEGNIQIIITMMVMTLLEERFDRLRQREWKNYVNMKMNLFFISCNRFRFSIWNSSCSLRLWITCSPHMFPTRVYSRILAPPWNIIISPPRS